MFPAMDIAAELKTQAFSRLDQGRGAKPKMLYVDANKLIDLCLAFESAAEGDVSNLEYSLKVLMEDKKRLMNAIDKISDLVHSDSEVWKVIEEIGAY